MDPVTLASIGGGACCCLMMTLLLVGVGVWFMRRGKASASAALETSENTPSGAPRSNTPPPLPAHVPAPQGSGGDDDEDKRAKLAAVIGNADQITGLDNIKILDGTGMRLVRQSGESALMEDPDDEDRLWIWAPTDGGADVPAERWVDQWGPLPPGDLDAFCDHWCDQQDAEGLNMDRLDEILAGMGYPTVGHWQRVYWTAVKHFGRSPGAGGLLSDFDTSEMLQHTIQARMRQQARKAQANVAADSSLLAPVEGITVEVYAACAAAAAQGLSQDEFTALIGSHGMDHVMWDRVNAEWTDRMSKDATMTIVQIYGNAFQSSGQGQFGGAAQSAAATRTAAPGGGGAAAGEEPVPFDRLCEIQGAMSAWSATGQDVNAMLKEVFDINALAWSNMSSWWMTKMMADMSLFDTYNAQTEHYEAQYKAAAGVTGEDPDADIQF